jgi:hypothetical protein
VWGDKQWEAICALKTAIVQNPKLHPSDLTKQFELQTDASAYALSTTLFQKDDHGKKLMIGAAS